MTYTLMCCGCAGSPGVHALDPLRLTVATGGWALSGQAVAQALDARFGVVPELATQQARVKNARRSVAELWKT